MNTEIQLPVAELKSIVPGLNKVISKRSSLPVLGCVRIERSAKGNVTLQATDLDDHVTARLKEPQPGEPTTVLVPWEPLSKAIKGSNNRETVVLVQDKKGASLRTFAGGSSIEHKLETVDLKEWPPFPQVNRPGITLNQDLRQALQQALECASEDSSRRVLNTACLDVSDPKAHYVVGTNARIVFSANSFTFDLKDSVLIPNRKFLSSFLDEGDCTLSIEQAKVTGKKQQDGWVQLNNDRWTFITKQIEEKFPNWKNIVPKEIPTAIVKLDTSAVKSLLEIIPKLPGDEIVNSPVRLAIAKGQLQIKASGKNQDKPTAVIIHGATIIGKEITVGMNRHYLTRALEFGLNELRLNDAPTPVVCLAEGRRLMIAPLGDPDAPNTAPAAPVPPAPTEEESTSPIETNNERTTMRRNTTTAQPVNEEAPASESAVKAVIQQVENIKEALKGVVGQCNEVLASLKLAEKEKRASEKEIESVRESLRSIQSMSI